MKTKVLSLYNRPSLQTHIGIAEDVREQWEPDYVSKA